MKIIRPYRVREGDLVAASISATAPAPWFGGTVYAADAIVEDGGSAWRSRADDNQGHAPATSPDWWAAQSYGAYNPATVYAAGAIVYSAATRHEYQSVSDGNVGQALSDPAHWIDLGFINRWRMLDQSNTSQSADLEAISASIAVSGRADSVALLNIVGAAVRVQVETAADGPIFDESYSLVSDSGVDSWFDYFFEPIVRKGDFIVDTLPLNGDPTITVTLDEPGGLAMIGTLVVGQKRDFGELLYGARVGIQDYSRKVADDFGNYTIVERAFSKRATFRVALDNDQVDAVVAMLSQYRATPVVYIGSDQYASTWIYGFYRDFGNDIDYPTVSYLSLEIEGLT